jgi:hypothetical protein
MMATRVALGLVCAVFLAGCASAHAFRVERSDVIGPCQTTVPERNLLLGVAISGGGSRAALFGAARLEALARLRTADDASVRERLAEIPTRLVLPSECDRQLLAGAAAKLVTEHRDAILEFMNHSDTIGLRGRKGR